jgi:hypothetical protein
MSVPEHEVEVVKAVEQALVDPSAQASVDVLFAARKTARFVFEQPLSDALAARFLELAGRGGRHPRMFAAMMSFLAPKPRPEFVAFFLDGVVQGSGDFDDAVSALQALPIEVTAGPLLKWREAGAPSGRWLDALLDKAALFVAEPGVVVPLRPDSPSAWLHLPDIAALELALAHGLPADVEVDGNTLLEHCIKEFFHSSRGDQAAWLRLARAAVDRGADLHRKLTFRFGPAPVFKKGLTPAGMVAAAASWSSRDEGGELARLVAVEKPARKAKKAG